MGYVACVTNIILILMDKIGLTAQPAQFRHLIWRIQQDSVSWYDSY